MSIWQSYDESKNNKRWVCYFDLLGIKSMIKLGSEKLFSIYARAIEEAKERSNTSFFNIDVCWFSDTFIAYTKDDSVPCFTEIDSFSRWFVYFMIRKRIPLRGAISCAELYADQEHNILFGAALVEAYKYGEAADWIGVVVCPSAEAQMKAVNFPLNKNLGYAVWDIPYNKKKVNVDRPRLQTKLGACVFDVSPNGKSTMIPVLVDMQKEIEKSCVTQKYSNTIEFLKANLRCIVGGS